MAAGDGVRATTWIAIFVTASVVMLVVPYLMATDALSVNLYTLVALVGAGLVSLVAAVVLIVTAVRREKGPDRWPHSFVSTRTRSRQVDRDSSTDT